MTDISLTSEYIVNSKISVTCKKCKKEVTFTINKDGVISLTNGQLMFVCPQCGQEYELTFMLNVVKKKGV